MADKPVVRIGENSPEHVAYQLMRTVLGNEAHQKWNRKLILDICRVPSRCDSSTETPARKR
jgi:hypothetical protein